MNSTFLQGTPYLVSMTDIIQAPFTLEAEAALIHAAMHLVLATSASFEKRKLDAINYAKHSAAWLHLSDAYKEFVLRQGVNMTPMARINDWCNLYKDAEQDATVTFEHVQYGIRFPGMQREQLTDVDRVRIAISLAKSIILTNFANAFYRDRIWTPPIVPTHIEVRDIPATTEDQAAIMITARFTRPTAGWEDSQWAAKAPVSL